MNTESAPLTEFFGDVISCYSRAEAIADGVLVPISPVLLKDAGIVSMRRVGTKNYYYVDADESQWRQMAEFTSYIYEVAKDISVHGSCREVNDD